MFRFNLFPAYWVTVLQFFSFYGENNVPYPIFYIKSLKSNYYFFFFLAAPLLS
jgi:hypothetical protein